jgi:hypothetical protein
VKGLVMFNEPHTAHVCAEIVKPARSLSNPRAKRFALQIHYNARRLLRTIINPAMIATWLLGLWLAWHGPDSHVGWRAAIFSRARGRGTNACDQALDMSDRRVGGLRRSEIPVFELFSIHSADGNALPDKITHQLTADKSARASNKYNIPLSSVSLIENKRGRMSFDCAVPNLGHPCDIVIVVLLSGLLLMLSQRFQRDHKARDVA